MKCSFCNINFVKIYSDYDGSILYRCPNYNSLDKRFGSCPAQHVWIFPDNKIRSIYLRINNEAIGFNYQTGNTILQIYNSYNNMINQFIIHGQLFSNCPSLEEVSNIISTMKMLQFYS